MFKCVCKWASTLIFLFSRNYEGRGGEERERGINESEVLLNIHLARTMELLSLVYN